MKRLLCKLLGHNPLIKKAEAGPLKGLGYMIDGEKVICRRCGFVIVSDEAPDTFKGCETSQKTPREIVILKGATLQPDKEWQKHFEKKEWQFKFLYNIEDEKTPVNTE